MTPAERAALVKKALTTFAHASNLGIIPDDGEKWDDDLWSGMTAAIDLIRAEVLEQAAKVARECAASHPHCAEAIANAIRALKGGNTSA